MPTLDPGGILRLKLIPPRPLISQHLRMGSPVNLPTRPSPGGASSGATGYEYCYDTTNDNACSSWTSNGTSTSEPLSGLANGTTYYWQVRAVNSGGTTYANGSTTAFWSFTTVVKSTSVLSTRPVPPMAHHSQSTSPTLTWGSSSWGDHTSTATTRPMTTPVPLGRAMARPQAYP